MRGSKGGAMRKYFLFLVLLLSAQIAGAAGFELKKTNSGVAPEMCGKDKGVPLPGADMIAGEYSYVTDEKYLGDYVLSCKAGVLVKDGVLYYVTSMEKKEVNGVVTVYDNGSLDIGGDTNYGVYRRYLVIDSFALGSSHNRMMFLFKYGQDSVELLDVFDPSMSYSSAEVERRPIRQETVAEVMIDLRDFDNDGNPEMKLTTVPEYLTDENYEYVPFEFFIEIKDERLHMDFNPALYKPLFESHKRQNPSKKKKDAYYISGFFAGAMTLDNVKNAIRKNGEIYEGQFNRIVGLLGKSDTWDNEFHNFYGAQRAQPTLLRYEIKGR